MIQFQVTKEVFKIFNKDEKYIFFFLIAAQFISAGLELLSIGSLLNKRRCQIGASETTRTQNKEGKLVQTEAAEARRDQTTD